MKHTAVLLLFLCITYPLVTTMTRLKGRGWMFMWRHQLFHRRGPWWLREG